MMPGAFYYSNILFLLELNTQTELPNLVTIARDRGVGILLV